MFLFRLTRKTYLFPHVLVYLHIYIPVHELPVNFHTSIQINRQDLPVSVSTALHDYVYRHASHSSKHKDLPVITTTCVLSHTCTRSWPYLLIFILEFWSAAKIYPSSFLLRYCFFASSIESYKINKCGYVEENQPSFLLKFMCSY